MPSIDCLLFNRPHPHLPVFLQFGIQFLLLLSLCL